MEFEITRTSAYGIGKITDVTDEEMLEEIDVPYEFGARVKKIKLENGRKEKVVVIELNGIEDLMKLQDKVCNDLVITKYWRTSSPRIEIYDDYRE